MPVLSVARLTLKPGTGKATSAVWSAHIFVEAGQRVLLVDAAPFGSALGWSDLAAMDSRLPPTAAFPFRVVALPSRLLHLRAPEVAHADDVVIIDAPQLEDHSGIARSVMRYAGEILIPCAPSPIEINRTTRVAGDEIAEVQELRDKPARSAVLLTRYITRAHSRANARRPWRARAMTCCERTCRDSRFCAQSFGLPIPETGRGVWRDVAGDLIERCAPLRKVRL